MSDMDTIELLAPAGSMDSLKAAVANGADAVYLGGKSFNARQSAGNFEMAEIMKAAEYCHLYNVKVYVTVNTLLKTEELKFLPGYIGSLYNVGVDALIIQDFGVGRLIQDIIPGFELHASTQMTAHNLEAVNFLYGLGYKRVVLSRELSINEIKFITSHTMAETEVFCHGALCVCYSGQCLMSSMIGGRSGNRGRCAQPCRQKYFMDNNFGKGYEGYHLSPKDLSTASIIDSLIETGTSSLKIEGRMKSPEYVAAVVSVYRKAVDTYLENGKSDIDEDDVKTLAKAFNRGGFTTAHLLNKGGPEMMNKERPKNWGIHIGSISRVLKNEGKVEILLNDVLSSGDGIEIWRNEGNNIGYIIDTLYVNGIRVNIGRMGERVLVDYRGGQKGDRVYKTFDAEQNSYFEKTYKLDYSSRKIPVNIEFNMKKNVCSRICIMDIEGGSSCIEGPLPEKAQKNPLDKSRIEEQISKLGGTPFYAESTEVILDEGLVIPISSVNSMRRDAVEQLVRSRVDRYKRSPVNASGTEERADKSLTRTLRSKKNSVKISVFVRDSSLLDAALEGGADIIIFGGDYLRGFDMDYRRAVKKCNDMGIEIYLASPRIMKGEFESIAQQLHESVLSGARGIYADNLGMLGYCIKSAIPYASGFSLNIFNYITANELRNMGSQFISISPEVSLNEVHEIASYIEKCEVLCYGRIEMMVSEYCPVGSGTEGCCSPVKGELPCMSSGIVLTDKLGMDFPVRTDRYCRSHIFNSKDLSMLDSLRDLIKSGAEIIRLNMLDENPDEVLSITRAFSDSVDYINGYLSKLPSSVSEISEKIRDAGYTRGHYYRGVE
jgi:putative protease